jgi:hypothetical protein
LPPLFKEGNKKFTVDRIALLLLCVFCPLGLSLFSICPNPAKRKNPPRQHYLLNGRANPTRWCVAFVVVVLRSWRIYDFVLPLLRYQICRFEFFIRSSSRASQALIWRGKRRRF